MSWGYLLLALLPDTLPGTLISWSELVCFLGLSGFWYRCLAKNTSLGQSYPMPREATTFGFTPGPHCWRWGQPFSSSSLVQDSR